MDAFMCKGHPNRRPERDLSEGARGQQMLGDIMKPVKYHSSRDGPSLWGTGRSLQG